MSKCKFVYETEPGPIFNFAPQRAILRCTTHNCTTMGTSTATMTKDQVCLYGRIEALEERVAQLERPQSNISTDELGNPFSLRRPAR
jgi:hypothetical protein